MKKIGTIITSLVMILFVVFGLTACGSKDKVELPSSNYEKVQFAFNGVESSLKNSNSSKKLKSNYASSDSKMLAISYGVPSLKLMANSVNSDDISTIYNAMVVEEKTSNPSFEYDEPPMIQFQYLKALYEEMGDKFEFGTKYSNTSTGTIYYDFETRTSKNEEQYLNAYSFTCSISLNIDSEDLINAYVGFDLTFTNNGVSRHEKMYVELYLDYDMNSSSPTYELSMNAITDLLDYQNENEKYFNDEYDYVKVDKNFIKEWRKFGICSPDSLNRYQNDNFVYKYSVLRAFKDSSKYKLENSFNSNQTLKNAVIDCLDLSNSLAGYDSFFNLAGNENDKIKTVVDKFSSIYGRDIVNNLVYTGATEKWVDDREPEPENLFLRVESTGGFQLYQDIKIDYLFNPNIGWDEKGQKQYLTIYYKNGEDNTIDTFNSFNNLNVKVRSTAYENAKWIDIDSSNVGLFTDYIKNSGFKGYYDENNLAYTPITLEFDISLKSNPEVKLQSNFEIELYNENCYLELLKDWDLVEDYINCYAPIKDAIPAFDNDSDVYFSPSVDGASGNIGLNANNGLATKISSYINKLKNNLGFVENTYNSTYTKRVSDDYVLVLTIYAPNEKSESGSIRFEFQEKQKPNASITEVLQELINNDNIVIPEFDGDYEYSLEDNVVRIQTDDSTLTENYINSFANDDFVVYESYSGLAAIKYVDGTFYQIRDMGKSIAVEKITVSFSLVGDFNSWNEQDTTYDLIELSAKDNNLYLSKGIALGQNQAFKIVRNHSWNNGGYGFNLGAAEPSFVENFDCGENENIITRESGKYIIKIRIDFYYVYGAPENHVDPLMIEIESQ